MTTIKTAAPQFLVDNLRDALAFYESRLGFQVDFVYDDFYASVSREGATLHLKCAPKLQAEREHRAAGQHIDAHLDVSGAETLYEEFAGRGVAGLNRPEKQPWGRIDFTVEDPDGYRLCFSEDP